MERRRYSLLFPFFFCFVILTLKYFRGKNFRGNNSAIRERRGEPETVETISCTARKRKRNSVVRGTRRGGGEEDGGSERKRRGLENSSGER